MEQGYWAGVAARIHWPGLGLLLLGAALVYGSTPLSRRLFPTRQEGANLALKGVGCLLCLAGTLLALRMPG